MPLTRSNNQAVAAVQHLGQDFADMIHRMGDYLKQVVTSQDPDWMGHIREWIRWILEKMREFYERMAWAIGCKQSSLASSSEMKEASSSAKENILKAVEMAKLWAMDLMYGVRASIYEALDAVKAKIQALNDTNESEEDEKTKEEEAKEEEPDEGYEAEDDEDSEDDGPSAKRIRLE